MPNERLGEIDDASDTAHIDMTRDVLSRVVIGIVARGQRGDLDASEVEAHMIRELAIADEVGPKAHFGRGALRREPRR